MSNATQYREERQPLVREVQRKANVGERIKIVDAHLSEGKYAKGDELIAVNIRTVRGEQRGVYAGTRRGKAYIFDDEYVVLEPIAPAAPTTANLPDLFAQFIRDNAPAVRSYLAEVDPDKCAEPTEEVSVSEPELTRAKVIEMARERVAELERIGSDRDSELTESVQFSGTFYAIEFLINRDKRAVTALVHPTDSGGSRVYRKPDAVGIAKCAPDDVFNADIGKAIAAERALGLTLTPEFVNAPKPAGKVAGMIVSRAGRPYKLVTSDELVIDDSTATVFSYTGRYGNIIDDTDADYTQKAGEAA